MASNGTGRKRAIRIGDCSGAASDPGVHMLNQALYGDVDVITGDYLAEMNLASNAEAMKGGKHPGYEPTAWDGLSQSLKVLAEKKIKVVINGGALRPLALAQKTLEAIKEHGLDLTVAYVSGDDLMDRINDMLKAGLDHLDSANDGVKLPDYTTNFIGDSRKPLVSANAYLGARAITAGLKAGADIIICGRVSDASPVIGAARWWHGWADDDFDELGGALVAGHLIECSTYSTGANFSGFDRYPLDELMDLGLPIAEIEVDGSCVITKADKLNGFVTKDIITNQLLYEIQGNLYLNSDVKADLADVRIVEEGTNRVRVKGVKGYPPPSTTKGAIYYAGGYQCEITFNATGYNTQRKYDLIKMQITKKLKEWGVLDKFDVLEFQVCGAPRQNPGSQLESTTSMRIFAQGPDPQTVSQLPLAMRFNGMAHPSGIHGTLDYRTAIPQKFLAYYPALIPQAELKETVTILNGPEPQSIAAGTPPKTEDLQRRETYDTTSSVDLSSFGESVKRPFGDIVQGRSGDKGANINAGFFVQTAEQFDWLRSFLSTERMQALMGSDWRDDFWMERVEFPHIFAVHFVIYGPLGRGVSSSAKLDCLGKGFADFIRYVEVDIPIKFLE